MANLPCPVLCKLFALDRDYSASACLAVAATTQEASENRPTIARHVLAGCSVLGSTVVAVRAPEPKRQNALGA